MKTTFTRLSILAMAFAALSGCSAQRAPQPLVVPDIPGATRVQSTALPMFDGATGEEVDWRDLVARAARADAVLIGETHSLRLGLAAAAELFEQSVRASMDAGLDSRPALALEFFDRETQIAIDDYLAGVIEEVQFLEYANRTAGNYPPGHRAMVEIAKREGLPVTAANAPRRYVRLARTDGVERYEAMTPSQRRLFETPGETTEGRYREDFFDLMGGAAHGDEEGEDQGPTEEEIEGFFLSQNVWDATMADTVADALEDGYAPVFLVVGRFHTDYEGGLTQRLRERTPDAEVLTISVLDAREDSLHEDDEGRADVVIYAGAPESN
jgi:uncharacterized iron-regulated protein